MFKMFENLTLKKGLIISILVLTVLVSVTIGTTLAFLTDSEEKVNHFTYGSIDVELKEPEWDDLDPEDKVVYPERSIPKDPFVTNTGTVDIYAYLEVHIPRASVRTVGEDKTTIIPAKLQDLFTFVQSGDWTKIEESVTATEHVLVFAYTKGLIAPGESSSPLFENVKFINMLEGELAKGTTLEMPIRTFAIQSNYLDVTGDTLAEKLYNAYLENKATFEEGGNP